MKKLILTSFAAAFMLQAKAQTFTHAVVPLSGFTADVIADGTGPAASSTNNDVDGENFNFVAQNFVNPSNQSPTSYLPTGGLINSFATPGLPFQLAPYNANNSLRLNATTTSGTLTFITPRAADKLNILATTAYTGTFTATVNFTDATTQVFAGNVVPNWFDGTAPNGVKGVSRVGRLSDGIENNANNPRMYQYVLVLSPANTSKNIQSITFTKTTTGVKEVLHIFAVTASSLLPNDIGISTISSPVSPVAPTVSQPVTVSVINYGSSPLSSATIGWSVNKVAQPDFAFTASPALAMNGISSPVTIGNLPFPVGTHKIKAWTKLPNGVADGAAANDTVVLNLVACNALNGNYTIDKNSPASATSFQSFADARQILNSCGVSGPVTFTVAANSGPYNEQIVLTSITGASATNTITFEGNGNTVSASPGTTNQGVFTLDGADFVKINNFTLTLNPTSATGFGIQLKNTADNITITNNTINLPLTSSLSTVAGIIAGTSGTATGNNTSNSIIQNNTINGGYYGISINGTTGNVGAVNNQIKNNQVKDPYLTGIYLNNVTNNIIEGNDISRMIRTNGNAFNGIYLVGASIGNQIRKNKVHNTHDVATSKTGTVQCFYTQSAGAVGSENIFSNNLAYNLNNGGGTVYVYYNNGGTNTWYLYNTISADNPAINFSTLRGIYFLGSTTNVKLINNNFSLESPATNKHAIYLSGIITSDRNNLYVGTTGNIGYSGSNKATLADWKLVSSGAYDQNSVSANPIFINPAAGNLQPTATALNDIGAPQTAVTDDITGAPRNATTPDPGAYEFVPAAANVGISAILSPNSGCGLTNQEVVSVTLNNFGAVAQINIPVTYTINGGTPVTETFAGPLAPGASVTYNFTTKANLSNPIIYTLIAQTNLAGDIVTSDDATSKVIDAIPLIATFPYIQNFETNDGGWRSGGTASSWALGTPAKTVINSAASGTKAWITGLTAAHNNQEKSQVVSPCINLSSLVNPVFEMKAWWNSQFSNDGAVLQSSIDGGTTWQVVGAFGDPNNWYNDNTIAAAPGGQPTLTAIGWTGRTSTSNGSNGWVTVKHDLTGLGGQSNVKLRIAFGADATTVDDGFAFDDVMIYEAPTNDAGVTAIITPNSGCGLTNLETVTVTIKNFGSTTLTSVPVNFAVDGGVALVSPETYNGSIAPNATVNYTFTATANLSAIGTHTIVAFAKVAGDNLAVNDSTRKTIYAIPTVSTLPYTEGFENGNGGWYAGGVSSSWALGTPAKPVINTAAAGTKSWVTSLTGSYNSWENSSVVGPCFNFSGKPDPDFEMKAWWNSEFSADGTVLQSSIDGGTTWQNVGAKGDPTNWYNDNSLNGSPGGQPFAIAQGWSGSNATTNGSGGWTTVKHRLTGLGGKSSVLLRIAFGADGLTHDDGFAFDEIRIIDNTNNLAVNSVVPLTKSCGYSAAEPITALIENVSPVSATGFTVSYTINGGTPVTQTYTGTLASGSSANFTFTQTANFTASGNYTIVVTVNMPGDMDASNNSATYSFSNSSFTGLPPVFNFEPAGNGILQFVTVTKSKSAIIEGTGASFGTGTQGMIMDGVDNAGWTTPSGAANPWTINPNNFSGAYICFNPSGGAANDSLWLTFDLKQLFKGANANTNLRITVNGTQVGTTFRPPFSGTPIVWTPIKVDLTAYKNLTGIQVGIESSVKEAFANGAGTANLIDNVMIKRRIINGVKADLLASQLHVFPNPSTGIFNIDLPKGKTYELEVTDLTGKVIMKQTAKGENNQINLEKTAKGIYLLKVSGENGYAVRKLIVE